MRQDNAIKVIIYVCKSLPARRVLYYIYIKQNCPDLSGFRIPSSLFCPYLVDGGYFLFCHSFHRLRCFSISFMLLMNILDAIRSRNVVCTAEANWGSEQYGNERLESGYSTSWKRKRKRERTSRRTQGPAQKNEDMTP